MSDKTIHVKSGASVGILSLLALLFIALKLTGYIEWSWLWVLAPLWLPWVVAVAVVAIIGLGIIALALRAEWRKEKQVEKTKEIHGIRWRDN